jgi:hypothetical protein
VATTYARLAGETTPGTEASAATLTSKKVFVPADEVTLVRGEAFLNRDEEMRGLTEGVPLVPETFTPSWGLKSRLYPDTLGIVFANAFGLSATGETGGTHYVATAGNGVITDPDSVAVPTGATRHVWTAPLGPSGLTPRTCRIDGSYGNEGVFMVGRGCATEQIQIETPDQGGAMLTAGGPALYVDEQSDPSLTPTVETVATRPMMRGGQAVVTWLSGSATMNGLDIAIGLPVEAVRALSATASLYPSEMEKGDALMAVTGSVDLRHVDSSDLAALKAATEFAAKIRWKSDTAITGSYAYGLWIEMSAAQYSEGTPDPIQNRRRHGARFNFRAARNASASVTITLVNNVASYA